MTFINIKYKNLIELRKARRFSSNDQSKHSPKISFPPPTISALNKEKHGWLKNSVFYNPTAKIVSVPTFPNQFVRLKLFTIHNADRPSYHALVLFLKRGRAIKQMSDMYKFYSTISDYQPKLYSEICEFLLHHLQSPTLQLSMIYDNDPVFDNTLITCRLSLTRIISLDASHR